jgi:alpha-1,3-mannosyltransferase
VGTQIALGAPFLATYPREYLSRAFELGRVFTHKWSVNFKFVSEDIFVSKSFAKYLLLAHLVCLFVFAHRRWCAREGGFFFNFVRDFFKRLLLGNVDGVQSTFTPAHVALVLAQSNLIGIVFARSLHYQFYSWYFHTIPLLLWSNPRVPVGAKLAIMGAIEWCWNVYPSTPTSSKIFVVIHLGVLAVAYAAPTASRRGKQKSA